MQIRFVGCGDAIGSGGRLNTCFHVSGQSVNFLIDCGATSLPALKRYGILREDLDLILITHFHADHFGGLPFMMLDAQFMKRKRPLVIAGPLGIDIRLTRLMEAMFEYSSATKPNFDLQVLALEPAVTRQFGAVTVTPFPVVHGDSGGPFFAYRIEAEGRILAYSGDTQWTDQLVAAAHDADLFICEAYTYERTVKNHISLKALETHLPEINPKRVILTHMGDEVLHKLDTVPHMAASDGLIVPL
ncbi:MBL fold metallo-hydrolase [Rhodopseudomonas sp. BR0G17]|uniref:MBL fold metallo-hydrolase n=1 Tax=Rhodopseudomonas sp. BR0G17 TaxID=2269368 RepID=UPI0013E00635|nr:MBL fold metallo-hydrolase [Rhodopseudomonas sp. BR0G17]NEW95654.1 MBL fold metallo-hydrolase [Rhodopseudomonas sp. BR0G17]